jgi:hypothetical protein
MNGHQSEGVARDGPVGGVVYVVELGPLLDVQNERLHAPILIAVAFEQVRVSYAYVTVYIQIAL